MAAHDYPLQALLYSVALHRYLRWRIADYDPTVHLGGVAYLFVRGMVGPDTPVVDGAPTASSRGRSRRVSSRSSATCSTAAVRGAR